LCIRTVESSNIQHSYGKGKGKGKGKKEKKKEGELQNMREYKSIKCNT